MATVLGRPAGPTAVVTTEDLLEQLRTGIADLASSEAWVGWLCAARKFHRYSFSNQLLIALQRPDATQVSGYRKWQQFGRQVRKGEKGITIIAPCVHKVRGTTVEGDRQDEIDVRVTGFTCAHVFDGLSRDSDSEIPKLTKEVISKLRARRLNRSPVSARSSNGAQSEGSAQKPGNRRPWLPVDALQNVHQLGRHEVKQEELAGLGREQEGGGAQSLVGRIPSEVANQDVGGYVSRLRISRTGTRRRPRK